LRALCEKSPDKLKQALEKIINNKATGNKDDLMKVCFMYFFELMGINLENGASMKVMIDLVLAKNSATGKSKQLTKE
jgi:hypothetical protein